MKTEELIKLACQGDVASCNRLAKSFFKILYRYFINAWRLSAQEAEEMTQDTFIEVWSSLKSFEGKSWRSWLMTIARRVAWKTLRAKPPTPLYASPEEESHAEDTFALENPVPTQEDIIARQQEYQVIHGLIAELRLEYRELLHLYYLEELSTDEISTSMDIPLGTVKIWLYRARNELKQKWISQNNKSRKSLVQPRRRP